MSTPLVELLIERFRTLISIQQVRSTRSRSGSKPLDSALAISYVGQVNLPQCLHRALRRFKGNPQFGGRLSYFAEIGKSRISALGIGRLRIGQQWIPSSKPLQIGLARVQ